MRPLAISFGLVTALLTVLFHAQFARGDDDRKKESTNDRIVLMYKQVGSIAANDMEYPRVVFSSDGETLAAVSRRAVDEDRVASAKGVARLWEFRTKKVKYTIQTGTRDEAVAFAPDGKTVLLGHQIGKTSNGEVIRRIGHRHHIKYAEYSPTGDRILCTSVIQYTPGEKSDAIFVLDPKTGKTIASLEPKERENVKRRSQWLWPAATWSPDGKYIATCLSQSGATSEFILWSAESYEPLLRFDGKRERMLSLAFSPDSRVLAATGQSNQISLWKVRSPDRKDIDAKKLKQLIVDLDDDEFSVREAAHAKLIAIGDQARHALTKAVKESDSAEVRSRARLILTAQNKELLKPLQIIDAEARFLKRVAFSPDGRYIATCSEDRHNCIAQIWNAADLKQPAFRIKRPKGIYCIAFSSDKKTLAVAERGGDITFWQASHVRLEKVDANKSIDLVALGKSDSAHVEGQWLRQGKTLTSQPPNRAILTLPVRPHGDYELSIKLARIKGPDSANIALPIGDAQCMFVIGGWPKDYKEGERAALDLISNQGGLDKNPTAIDGMHLKAGLEYQLGIRVTSKGESVAIQIKLDDKQIIKWSGLRSQLSLTSQWKLSDNRAIGLGSFDTIVEFREAKLRMLSGYATVLRAEKGE